MPQSPEWLFRGLESAGVDARRSAPARIATAAVGFLLMLPQIELGLLSAWTAAVIACEVWTIFATRGLNAAHPATRSQRTRYLISCLATTWVWNLAPMILWASGDPGLRIIAVVILAGFLIHAQGFAYRSWLVLLINGGSSTLNLLLLPVLFGGLAPVQQATLYGALALLAAYAMVSATMARGAHEALDAARVEAEAASEAKSAFLAMMSHELRTPMNGILGMAHALQQAPLNPRQAEQVGMLVRSGDGLMAILNDILDLSKIEAGRLDLELAPLDLGDLVRLVCGLWSESAAAKGLDLSVDIEPALPRALLGDATRLRQILQNLLSNALKFTEAGEVRVVVAVAPSSRADLVRVEIAVSDTGLGISADQQTRLFQPFVQAEASTARRFGGAGLGLAICRRLAALMGGEITLDSTPGRGSTFRVTLDLPVAEAPPEAEDAPAGRATPLAGLNLLVAEDNVVNQAVARAILEALGARIVVAGDGAQALAALKAAGEAPYDLVLMDIHMPVMDGIATLAAIRSGPAARTPVIALTADAMSGQDQRLLSLGFDAVQPKPIQPGDLVAAILGLTQVQQVGATRAGTA